MIPTDSEEMKYYLDPGVGYSSLWNTCCEAKGDGGILKLFIIKPIGTKVKVYIQHLFLKPGL